jgi:hypothetical protein
MDHICGPFKSLAGAEDLGWPRDSLLSLRTSYPKPWNAAALLADCDLVLIDTPPGRSAEAPAAVEAADLVLIPFWLESDTFDGLAKFVALARRLGKPAVGFFATPNSRSHIDTARTGLQSLGVPMSPGVLHRYEAYRMVNPPGLTVREQEPTASLVEAIGAYRTVALFRRLWKQPAQSIRGIAVNQISLRSVACNFQCRQIILREDWDLFRALRRLSGLLVGHPRTNGCLGKTTFGDRSRVRARIEVKYEKRAGQLAQLGAEIG